jgi:hypothetical protein
MNSQEIIRKDVPISPFVIYEMPIVQIREAVMTNLGETMTVVDFERIKIPAGGGTAWTLQTLDGEKFEKELTGILVGWRDTRAYWKVPMEQSDGNAPPNCSSIDARTGIGEPGGDCRRCQFAQFGTGANGEGQACKQVRQLFLLRQENVLPEIVNLPPSSLTPVREYFRRLSARALPCYSVITRIGLEKAQNPRGITYSKATFTAGEQLSPDQVERAYAAMLKPFVESISAPTLKDHLAEGEVV